MPFERPDHQPRHLLGVFNHRWVAVKWLLTVACIIFGTFYIGPRINGQPPLNQALGLAAAVDPLYLSNRASNMAGRWLKMAILLFMVAILRPEAWKERDGSDSGK